jgi:hypothetical protein
MAKECPRLIAYEGRDTPSFWGIILREKECPRFKKAFRRGCKEGGER